MILERCISVNDAKEAEQREVWEKFKRIFLNYSVPMIIVSILVPTAQCFILLTLY
jgi:hypothetical protein